MPEDSTPPVTVLTPVEATALEATRQGRFGNQRCALKYGGCIFVATYVDGTKEAFAEAPAKLRRRDLDEVAQILAHTSSTTKPITPASTQKTS